jgi:hypothetical protein
MSTERTTTRRGVGLGVIVLAVTSLAVGGGIHPSCTVPFDKIKAAHQIDDACPAEGTGKSPAQQAQNTAKNNFCATGTPAEVTAVSFRKLQAKAKAASITFGSDAHLPEDRTKLKDLYTTTNGDAIGEGSLVRLVAYVTTAHYSNVQNGESVNCKRPGTENNDIHIVLGAAPTTAPCQSVTAEMSPHFRPDTWTPKAVNKTNGHPVRLTGQLFFDAAHQPCTPGHPANPKRISLWEIHPVYAADVCSKTAITDCPVNDDTVWTPLDQATQE